MRYTTYNGKARRRHPSKLLPAEPWEAILSISTFGYTLEISCSDTSFSDWYLTRTLNVQSPLMTLGSLAELSTYYS